MRYKGLAFSSIMVLALFLSTAALATEAHQGKGAAAVPDGQTAGTAASATEAHQGKVLSAGAGKLTMTDLKGSTRQTHEVAANAQIMCDGKKCGLSDVKTGDMVMVTLDKNGDKTVATKIEAKSADSSS